MPFKYKITIEYTGTAFCGWQRQKNSLSVQEIIEKAIYQFTSEHVRLQAAGRTDAGVHALGQVAHFELLKEFSPSTIINAINHFVQPYPVSILYCQLLNSDFHARFSAKARHYIYKIKNREGKVVVDVDRVWWIRKKLNVSEMEKGAKYLVGQHDFTSFRASSCQARSPIKTLTKIDIQRLEEEILIYISAPSFLHHMVRNIVGSLVLVGMGKWEPKDIQKALKACNRNAAGPTAPACGLYFLKVDY